MAKQTIENFKGLNTEADIFSTDNTTDSENCIITINNDIEKAKGFTRVDPLSLSFTGVSKAASAVVSLDAAWSPSSLLEVNKYVMIINVSDSEFRDVMSGKIWQISAVDTVLNTITLNGCDTSGVISTEIPTGDVDISISSIVQGSSGFPITFPFIFGHFTIGSGSLSTSLKSLGAFFDGQYLLNFIYDEVQEKSFLLYTLRTEISWKFVEGYETPTEWGSGVGKFVKYKGDVVFVKNETRTIGGNTGGVFWIDGDYGSATIRLYGNDNNPTGNNIKSHKERLWVSGLSAIGSDLVDGLSWCMLSKQFPETVDTKANIISALVGARTTFTLGSGHGFNAGDTVFIEGAAGTAGIDVLNGSYFEITEINDTQIVIDADTSGAVYTGNDGYVSLRGYNWSPDYNKFNAGVTGAGILFFDGNQTDHVIALDTNFGQMVIYRNQTIYFYTGEISTGNVSLSRRLDVPYGAVSESLAISASGTWFVSEYGISKIEGVGVKTTVTELDNILSITYSEQIKSDFNSITDKSAIVLHYVDRYLWVHDPNQKKTWAFDTLNGNWMPVTNQLVQSYYFNVNNEPYAIYGIYVLKYNDGYKHYNVGSDIYESYNSDYLLPLLDQNDSYNAKDYMLLYLLIEGVVTEAANAFFYIDIYLNGNYDTVYKTLTFDIKVDNKGDMVERHRYTLGTANNITFKVRQNEAYNFKFSRLVLEYQPLLINDFTAEST